MLPIIEQPEMILRIQHNAALRRLQTLFILRREGGSAERMAYDARFGLPAMCRRSMCGAGIPPNTRKDRKGPPDHL